MGTMDKAVGDIGAGAGKARARGLTLAELLAVLAVLGVLGVLAGGVLTPWLQRQRLLEARDLAYAVLTEARSQARRSSEHREVRAEAARLVVSRVELERIDGAWAVVARAPLYARELPGGARVAEAEDVVFVAPYGTLLLPEEDGVPVKGGLRLVLARGPYTAAVDAVGLGGKVVRRPVERR